MYVYVCMYVLYCFTTSSQYQRCNCLSLSLSPFLFLSLSERVQKFNINTYRISLGFSFGSNRAVRTGRHDFGRQPDLHAVIDCKMYVCMYQYLCVRGHTCMYVCTCVYMYVSLREVSCACSDGLRDACMYASVFVCKYAHMYVCVCVCVYM